MAQPHVFMRLSLCGSSTRVACVRRSGRPLKNHSDAVFFPWLPGERCRDSIITQMSLVRLWGNCLVFRQRASRYSFAWHLAVWSPSTLTILLLLKVIARTRATAHQSSSNLLQKRRLPPPLCRESSWPRRAGAHAPLTSQPALDRSQPATLPEP